MSAPLPVPLRLLSLLSIARPHIVAIGALGALTFGVALCAQPPQRLWLAAACAAVDWFVVNWLNRVVDVREDLDNHVPGTALVARHARAFVVAGVSGWLLSMALTVWLGPPLLVGSRVAFQALGAVYNWPLVGVRLKQRYFWKNSASATGFLLTCFCYPLAIAAPRVGSAALVATVGYFLLFEVSYEVLYDMRDVDGDRAAGVQSYPVVHGVRGAWHIARALMLLSIVVLLGAWLAGLAPWHIAIMAAAPALQLALSSRMVARGGITRADCVLLTWLGAALLCGYHVWNALGLPGAAPLLPPP